MAWITSETSSQPWSYYASQAQNNAREMYAYFGASMTLQALAGLIGNVCYESYINPLQGEIGGGGGLGLIQWTPSTRLTSQVSDWRDPEQQLDLIVREGMLQVTPRQWYPTSTYPYTWSQFCALDDIETATRAYFKERERGTWSSTRLDIANYYYELLSGEEPEPGPDPGPTPPQPRSLPIQILVAIARKKRRHVYDV